MMLQIHPDLIFAAVCAMVLAGLLVGFSIWMYRKDKKMMNQWKDDYRNFKN